MTTTLSLAEVDALLARMTAEPGTRLPGARRVAARERTARDGVTIRKSLHDKLLKYAEG